MENLKRHALTSDFSGYNRIRHLQLTPDLEKGIWTLVLELAKANDINSDYLRATFTDVSELKTDEICQSIGGYWGIVVNDLGDCQLERVKYQVYQSEEHAISFVCFDIKVENINNHLA